MRYTIAPRLAGAVALALLLGAPQLSAQNAEARLRARQAELQRVRQERKQLEQRVRELQSSAHDLAEELTLLERQAAVTARVVKSLDQQLSAITGEVDDASAQLVRAEDELLAKRARLRKRLSDIYKRGPLYSVEALLSAQTFGELIARYKYLHQLARNDRALVDRMEELHRQIRRQRGYLVRLQDDLLINRQEKAAEEQRLRALEQQRAASLAKTRRSAKQTAARLARIQRDEQRLAGVIASLEAARRRAEGARPATRAGASTLSTRALGNLAWPVDGEIIYRFGKVVNPNNTTTRWNGVGIAAPEGAPVRSVAAGEVAVAEAFGTYGLTVIVQHPGGDYSVYGSLSRIDVSKGARVAQGQVLGAVGSADPDLGPHLHLEIRPGGRAVDPLEWLRGKR